jgi:sugar O-acyltransferase (sialic acid O-acetyltransferase NeuD family)
MSDSGFLIGGGQHARVLLSIVNETHPGLVRGVVDVNVAAAESTGLPYLGNDDRLPDLQKLGYSHFLLGVGSVRDCSLRESLFLKALSCGLEPVSVTHPASWIASDVEIGSGAQILVRSVVNNGVVLGRNILINTAAIIEHDCVIGDHSHIATGAVLCGSVRIGKAVHIGAGAVVRQGLTIGDHAVVAAGAVVVESVPSDTLVLGVPAKRVVKSLV